MNPDLEKLFRSLESAIPTGIGKDLRHNIEAAIKTQLEKLELVSKEEFEVQQKILLRSQNRLSQLELEIAKLEAKFEDVINKTK